MPRLSPLGLPKKPPKKPGGGNANCSPGDLPGDLMTALLLDEMFSDVIAEQLRAKGHDILAVVADPALVGLPDDQVLAHASAAGRALVTANIKDFIPLDARYRAASQPHAGLILVSAKTFPQDRSFVAAVTGALAALLDRPHAIQPGRVCFLTRR
jgi:hypothetical protein